MCTIDNECRCNNASPECLYGGYRDNFTLYRCFGGMTPVSIWTYSVPQKVRAVWSHGIVCHHTVLCCVKIQNVVIRWSVSNMDALKYLRVLVFLLCNAHLLSLCLAFLSAWALWALLFGLMMWQLPRWSLRVWQAWTHTGHDIWLLLQCVHVCVFCKRGSAEFSPAL